MLFRSISVSNGLEIGGSSSTRKALYNYNDASGDKSTTLSVTKSQHNNSVLAKFRLNAPSYFNKQYHNAMISTGIKFDGTQVTYGVISGQYLHSQVTIGSPAFDSQGIPAITASLSHDTHSASVSISR